MEMRSPHVLPAVADRTIMLPGYDSVLARSERLLVAEVLYSSCWIGTVLDLAQCTDKEGLGLHGWMTQDLSGALSALSVLRLGSPSAYQALTNRLPIVLLSSYRFETE